MSNINQIWLAPICHEDGDGRLWCQDDVWGDDCGCGIAQHSAVRYVIAPDCDRDMQALREDRDSQQRACIDVMAERDALRAQVEAMRQALNHILAMQTRGFITLGDNATSMANDALQAEP